MPLSRKSGDLAALSALMLAALASNRTPFTATPLSFCTVPAMNTGVAVDDDEDPLPPQLARTRAAAITAARPVKLNMPLTFMPITSFLLSLALAVHFS
jgi:hypothetical protein